MREKDFYRQSRIIPFDAVNNRSFSFSLSGLWRELQTWSPNETADTNWHLFIVKQELESTPGGASTIPSVPYKPSVNCAYSQLVNRIQGTQQDSAAEQAHAQPPLPLQTPQNFSQMTAEQQQQYYHYYYAAQYYEYYKQLAQYQQTHGQAGSQDKG